MKTLSRPTWLAATSLLLCQAASADDADRHATISVGMYVDSAKAVVANAGLPNAGAKAFTAHPAGDRWLFYVLASDSADLVLRYSPSTSRVTDVSIHYLTTPRSRTEVAVEATSIRFFADGSYSIQFPPSTASRLPAQATSKSSLPTKAKTRQSTTRTQVPVDEIGTNIALKGRLGEPLGTMLTLTGEWSLPNVRAKDYSPRFTVKSVNGIELAKPVVFPVYRVHAEKNGTSAIPRHDQHRELDGTTWTMRAYETGAFASVPAEYWRERGAPAVVHQPAFVSELVGFVRREQSR